MEVDIILDDVGMACHFGYGDGMMFVLIHNLDQRHGLIGLHEFLLEQGCIK